METIRERATKAQEELAAWCKYSPSLLVMMPEDFEKQAILENRAAYLKAEADRIDALKLNWRRDPCYDLYATEGNEEYYDELYVYSLEQQLVWADKRYLEMRRKLDVLHEAFKILRDLDPNAF